MIVGIKHLARIVLKNPLVYVMPFVLAAALALPALTGQFAMSGSDVLGYFSSELLQQTEANLAAALAYESDPGTVSIFENQVDAVNRARRASTEAELIQAGADYWRAYLDLYQLGVVDDLGGVANALAFIRVSEYPDPVFFDQADEIPAAPLVAASYPLVSGVLWFAPALVVGFLVLDAQKRGALWNEAPRSRLSGAAVTFCTMAGIACLLSAASLALALLVAGLCNGWGHADYPAVWIQGDGIEESTAGGVVLRLTAWLCLADVFLCALMSAAGAFGLPALASVGLGALVPVASSLDVVAHALEDWVRWVPLSYMDPLQVAGVLTYANAVSYAPLGVDFLGCTLVLGSGGAALVLLLIAASAPRKTVSC